jgi:hypothetical protein
MASASDAVQDALNAALGTDADSQSANPEATEDVDNLSGKPEAGNDKPATDKASDKGDWIPKNRFSEVVKQKNEAIERLKSLESQFKSASEREDALKSRVGQLETDHQILDAIKNLARDERYKDHVVAIDRALQGLDDAEEKVEKAKETGDDKSLKAAEKRFAEETGKLQDLIAVQNAERLWDESNRIASEMLKELPSDNYTNEDKAVLAKLWKDSINWNHIEEHGRESIVPSLKDSLASVIKEYGTPRGALVARTKDEVTKSIPEAARPVDPATHVKSVLDKEWGKTDDNGAPVLDDLEFSKALGDLMRRTRAGA